MHQLPYISISSSVIVVCGLSLPIILPPLGCFALNYIVAITNCLDPFSFNLPICLLLYSTIPRVVRQSSDRFCVSHFSIFHAVFVEKFVLSGVLAMSLCISGYHISPLVNALFSHFATLLIPLCFSKNGFCGIKWKILN